MCNDKIKITHFAIVPKTKKDMKLTKSQKIIILKAKVIKLKAKLKEARMELAEKDEQIDRKNKLLSIARFPAKQPIESSEQLFKNDDTSTTNDDTLKAKPSEEQIKSRFDYDQDPITSTTLKTPNEWLKLMSEDERKLWSENREKADKYYFDLNENRKTTFDRFITFGSFDWSSTPQGYDYWNNLSNRYNN